MGRSYQARQRREAEREAFRRRHAEQEARRLRREGSDYEPANARNRKATEAEVADMKKGVWVGQDKDGRWVKAPF